LRVFRYQRAAFSQREERHEVAELGGKYIASLVVRDRSQLRTLFEDKTQL
jgi:hypothetical protein